MVCKVVGTFMSLSSAALKIEIELKYNLKEGK